jgi:hypothetical protein
MAKVFGSFFQKITPLFFLSGIIMEKLYYALYPPEMPTHAFTACLRALPEALFTLGAKRVRVGVPDVPVPDDDPYADMRRTAPAGFVSFWLNTAHDRAAAEALIREAAPRLAGYVVAESTILPNTEAAAGQREAGFLQVCGFAALPGLTRAALWKAWLEDHTAVAVQTQSTVFYNQNIVIRALTDGAPDWDAIVEERFPAEALNDRACYFAAGGDPGRMAANVARMSESCARFIDFATITLMNCGEYRFGGWSDLAQPAQH